MRDAARRAGGLAAAIAVVVAVVVACNGPRPPAEPASTGFRGGVLTGMRLVVAGQSGRSTFKVPDEANGDSQLDLVVDVQDADCDDEDDARRCVAPEDAVLQFTVSATMDLRRVVRVDGGRSASLLQEGAERRQHELKLGLPDLSDGRHCLLVAMVEDPAPLVREQFADHSVARAYTVNVGTSRTDHCRAEPVRESVVAPTVPGGEFCTVSVVGPSKAGLEIRRQVNAGTDLFASLSTCGDSSSGAYVRDGVLQTDGPFAPFTLDAGGEQQELRIVPVPQLESGSLSLVSIQQAAAELHATISQPVVVE